MPLGPEGTWKADPQPTGLAGERVKIAHLAISADGRRIGWTGLESSAQVWTASDHAETSSGPSLSLVQGLGVWYGLPSPARDGRIALIGEQSRRQRRVVPAGSARAAASDHGRPTRPTAPPQWMPGEHEIAYFTNCPRVPASRRSIRKMAARERCSCCLTFRNRPVRVSLRRLRRAATSRSAPIFRSLAMAIVQDGKPNVWVARLRHQRPDGTLTQVTFEREGGSYPVWSADGRWIAYQCNEGTDTNVCVTKADGGGRAQLTHEHGQSWVGGWKPDNDTMLFAAERERRMECRRACRARQRPDPVSDAIHGAAGPRALSAMGDAHHREFFSALRRPAGSGRSNSLSSCSIRRFVCLAQRAPGKPRVSRAGRRHTALKQRHCVHVDASNCREDWSRSFPAGRRAGSRASALA